MYETFYGFSEKPFTLLPDASFLYMGKGHSIAYSMLEYGLLNQAGFSVITGEVGSGKTTLIRHLLEHLSEDVTVGLVSNTHREMGELLQWVLYAFGQDYRETNRVTLFDTFTRFLIEEYAQNHRTVLIIDEAQNLHPQVLEELRMLSNVNADKNQVLQLILVGQPQLLSLLKRPELLQFRQRIAVDYHLNALDESDVLRYIEHRTRHAGVERLLFTEEAARLIYRASSGIPRIVNLICDTALVYGFADNKQLIDKELLQSVLLDKNRTGLTDYPIE
ncbi:MAG: AAA family ATPase [Gammaproteobacteria bacterium]|nr:AAA family ATPase [Gammaproteobacteria bacterium]MCB1850990.1 AAA family ATPase [Gammaproteobacteria bacterium]MCP5418180.1 AAA family ATPase [Chromatiaceae bacterium]